MCRYKRVRRNSAPSVWWMDKWLRPPPLDAAALAALHARVQAPAPKGHVRSPDGVVMPWQWADKRLECPAGCGFSRASLTGVKAHLLEVHGWSSCAEYACYCARCQGAVVFADVAHATAYHGKAAFQKDHLRHVRAQVPLDSACATET